MRALYQVISARLKSSCYSSLMRVVIHVDEAGREHWIETDPSRTFKVEHPDGSGLTDIDVMLKHHNLNPDARERGGWHLPGNIPGEEPGLTRWQRLVRACNHPDAHLQAKALGLKE